MPRRLPEVDAYIENAPAYARPILNKIRTLFHRADPKLEEAIKWGNPTFVHDGILGAMAAFKAHVGVSFWRGAEMKDPKKIFSGVGKTRMGAFQASSLKELPADGVLVAYVKEAVRLNTSGEKPKPRATKPAKRAIAVPTDLRAALAKNGKAKQTFEGFSPSNRRDYLEWITEAKQAATRERRLATAIEWLAEGKPRNWKYMKKW